MVNSHPQYQRRLQWFEQAAKELLPELDIKAGPAPQVGEGQTGFEMVYTHPESGPRKGMSHFMPISVFMQWDRVHTRWMTARMIIDLLQQDWMSGGEGA
jgi:hypothetical protein